jgi:hypothetical protein
MWSAWLTTTSKTSTEPKSLAIQEKMNTRNKVHATSNAPHKKTAENLTLTCQL